MSNSTNLRWDLLYFRIQTPFYAYVLFFSCYSLVYWLGLTIKLEMQFCYLCFFLLFWPWKTFTCGFFLLAVLSIVTWVTSYHLQRLSIYWKENGSTRGICPLLTRQIATGEEQDHALLRSLFMSFLFRHLLLHVLFSSQFGCTFSSKLL